MSCTLYCEQTPFRQLAQMYTSPRGQTNSCDYCTQTIGGGGGDTTKNLKQTTVIIKKLSTEADSQIHCITLQLFPALPRRVPFTHLKLPKVLPTEQGYTVNPRLPLLQVYSCSRPPPLAVQSSDFGYSRRSTYTK